MKIRKSQVLTAGLFLCLVIGLLGCSSGYFGSLDELRKEAEGDYTPPPGVPVITIHTQPANTNVTQGSISGSLTVVASVTNEATISFQWYSKESAEAIGSTIISGEQSMSFAIPPALTRGIYYYYCEVSASGGAAPLRSSVAIVTVKDPAIPLITIDTQPADTNVTEGSISASLSVVASVTNSATISYQWYKSAAGDNSGGSAIGGETGVSFAIPSGLTVGTYYYFCEVRATGGAVSVRSSVATVNVGNQPTLNASNFAVSDNTKTYSGVSQGATVSYTGSGVNSGTAGTITVYYTGISGTPYTESVAAPVNAGTYDVKAATNGGSVYALFAKASVGTLYINSRGVTISGIGAQNKTYNGNYAATPVGVAAATINGRFGADDVYAVAGTAAFTEKNADDNITVTFSGFTLGGAAAGNYTLTSQPADAKANITRLRLTIGAPSGSPAKVYDGNTAHSGSGVTLGNLTNKVSGDDVSVTAGSCTYNSPDVAAAYQLTIVYAISGADSGNYLAPENGTIPATITRAPVGFGTPAVVNTSYTPTLKLGDLIPQNYYSWVNPAQSLNAGSGQIFAAVYEPDGNHRATGNITVNVAKAAGAVLNAPTLASRTYNSITVNEVIAPDNGQSVEYASNTTNTSPSTGWQSELNFSGLSGNTTYYIFARAVENYNYNSAVSGSLQAKTLVSVSFTLSFEEIADDNAALPWTIGGNPYNPESILAISLSGSSITLSLGNSGQYDSIKWYVDGNDTANSSGTYTLNPANFKRTDVGIHSITVEVVTKSGDNYNRTIPFMVAKE